ncbi:DNA polymerase III subunit gamma/tau [Culicoidibacter larvae]|uniref:DNA-directed DNA polymerase n=1 Tax=Culicoidibacter larvae TaxID=2579976 RepID=A0A5R8QIW7_9FIRM|nr:DNA polymerase III subunit gamma/tau [Culicoidibacter larvae]TLG77197.1 DNA polymerase III subunit gamma/tau [Culicoidibacter larvae]
MYQALYRAYRPKKFSDVAGQSHVTTSLRNTIINNKLSHAYLFNGPRGTGKTSMAKLFAKALSCEHPINGEPCCECPACLAIEQTQVQDIIEIDAASNNGVDEIRQLRDAVKYAPTQLKYKVYIIDEVHMLSIGAFNALLKTLEEPPAHIIFILATTEVHKIPATVISRCQRYDFHRISEKDIAKRISYVSEQEEINISDDAIGLIAKLADGALRDALGLLDQVNAYTTDKIDVEDIYQVAGIVPKEMIVNCLKYLMTNNKELLTYFDYVFDHGKNINLFLQEIIEFLRDILIAKINNEVIEGAEEIIPLLNNEVIYQLIQILNDCLNDVKYARLPKITIQVALLKCANLFINTKYDIEVNAAPTAQNELEEQYTIPYLNDGIISQEIIAEENEPIIHDYNDNNSVVEIEHSEVDFLVEDDTDNNVQGISDLQASDSDEETLSNIVSDKSNKNEVSVASDWAIDDEQQDADEYTGGSQDDLVVVDEEENEPQEFSQTLFATNSEPAVSSEEQLDDSKAEPENILTMEPITENQEFIVEVNDEMPTELINDTADSMMVDNASRDYIEQENDSEVLVADDEQFEVEDLSINTLPTEEINVELENKEAANEEQSIEYYRSENDIKDVLGADTTIEEAMEYQEVIESVEQEQVDIVFDFQGAQEQKETRGMIPKYMEMIYSGNDEDEAEFQNYIGKHLQKIMAEVALQPEVSKLELFKRKWQVIEKDALNPIKSMLADTEPKIATNSEVVVSSYNKALVGQLRSRPSQQRVLDSVKDIVGENYNVIVIDEATWMKQREVFAQKWKRQEVNQEQVDVLSKEIEYVENDYDPDYVIEGQISLLDESEDSIVSDARALFGDDIVEVK